MSIAIISVGATFGYVFVTSPSVVFTNQRSLFRPQLVFFQAFLSSSLKTEAKQMPFSVWQSCPLTQETSLKQAHFKAEPKPKLAKIKMVRGSLILVYGVSIFDSFWTFHYFAVHVFVSQLTQLDFRMAAFYVLAGLHLGQRAGKLSWVELKLRRKFHSLLLFCLFWFL